MGKNRISVILALFIITVTTQSCKYDVRFSHRLLNSIDNKQCLSYNTKVIEKANKTEIIVTAYLGTSNKDIFAISMDKKMLQRPILKVTMNCIYLVLNSINYYETEIFHDEYRGLYEERASCDTAVYKYTFSDNSIKKISFENQKEKMILDIFEYKNSTYIVYDF